jgi:hypothetical protein
LLDDRVSYTWLPRRESPLIWHTLGVAAFAFLRNQDRSVESAEAGPEWEFAAKSGAGGSLEAKLAFEDLLLPFTISPDAVVPAGSYLFVRVGASYHFSHTRVFQLNPRVDAGTFYDGWQATVEVIPIWHVSPHLELSGSYPYTRVRFPDREQSLDVHLGRVRIGTALNTKLSTKGFLQFNSTTHALSANVRFRFNFREGDDLWIVYNEAMNTDRDRSAPKLPLTDTRAVLVKYTYTLHM